MKNSIQNFSNFFFNLKELKLVACFRLFLESDYTNIPEKNRDEQSDGITFLVFNKKLVIVFSPYSRYFTLNFHVIQYADIPKRAINISNNNFWKNKLGNRIIEFNLINTNHSIIPHGISFVFENKDVANLTYIFENEFTSDSLIID